MCLAVPGKIVAIRKSADDPITGTVGTVDFQGSRIEVGLAFTPEAHEGDWVLVHAGFALNVLDEQEALETWKYLELVDGFDSGLSDSPQDADHSQVSNGTGKS